MRSDVCRLCRTSEAKWVVLDDKARVYWELYITDRLKLDLKRTTQHDAYLACQRCRSQIERYNSRSKWPRELKFLPWS